MSLAEDIAALNTRVREAEQAHQRAVGARDQAIQAHAYAMQELRTKFDVETVKEAEELLRELERKICSLAEDIDAKLTEIGA